MMVIMMTMMMWRRQRCWAE